MMYLFSLLEVYEHRNFRGGYQNLRDRCRAFLPRLDLGPLTPPAEALVSQVAGWTGRTAAFDDDLTLVVPGIG